MVGVTACSDEEPALSADGPLDETAEVRPDLVVAEPAQVEPGGLVELTFPEETERGTPWALELRDGDTWRANYLLSSDANGGEPSWVGLEEPDRWAWDDIGVSGPGPDRVRVPDTAPPGSYRLCTANALDNICADLEITD